MGLKLFQCKPRQDRLIADTLIIGFDGQLGRRLPENSFLFIAARVISVQDAGKRIVEDKVLVLTGQGNRAMGYSNQSSNKCAGAAKVARRQPVRDGL